MMLARVFLLVHDRILRLYEYVSPIDPASGRDK